MNCNETRKLLSEYIDGVLDAGTEAGLRAHLDRCPECRQELDSLRQVAGLLHELEEVKPPANLLARIHAKLREGAQQPSRIFIFSYPQARVAIAATLVVSVCVYGYLHLERQRPAPSQAAPKEAPAPVQAEAGHGRAAVPRPPAQPELKSALKESVKAEKDEPSAAANGYVKREVLPAKAMKARQTAAAVEAPTESAVGGPIDSAQGRPMERNGGIWRADSRTKQAEEPAAGPAGEKSALVSGAPPPDALESSVRGESGESLQAKAGADTAEPVPARTVSLRSRAAEEGAVREELVPAGKKAKVAVMGEAAARPEPAMAQPVITVATTQSREAVLLVLNEFEVKKAADKQEEQQVAEQKEAEYAVSEEAEDLIVVKIRTGEYVRLIKRLKELGQVTGAELPPEDLQTDGIMTIRVRIAEPQRPQ